MTSYVSYFATPYGYTVRVFNGDDLITEYSAGNSQMCSQTYLLPEDSQAVSPEQLKLWARQTAEEMATTCGIPHDRLEYDEDSAEDEIATRRALDMDCYDSLS